MRSLVYIDPRYLTPLQNKEPDVCMRCLNKTARWRVGQVPSVSIECSFCLLYKTDWGKNNASAIAEFVGAVQKEIGRIVSNEDGSVFEEEADRIMMAIRIVSGSKMVFDRMRNSSK